MKQRYGFISTKQLIFNKKKNIDIYIYPSPQSG